jgi:hypothetical protein
LKCDIFTKECEPAEWDKHQEFCSNCAKKVIDAKPKIVSFGHCIFMVDAYRVDILNQTCSCKAWFYGKEQDKNGKKICKHIKYARSFEVI